MTIQKWHYVMESNALDIREENGKKSFSSVKNPDFVVKLEIIYDQNSKRADVKKLDTISATGKVPMNILREHVSACYRMLTESKRHPVTGIVGMAFAGIEIRCFGVPVL